MSDPSTALSSASQNSVTGPTPHAGLYLAAGLVGTSVTRVRQPLRKHAPRVARLRKRSLDTNADAQPPQACQISEPTARRKDNHPLRPPYHHRHTGPHGGVSKGRKVRRGPRGSIRALKRGDPDAWSGLVHTFSPKVVGYARRMGARDPEEVMGATLETVARRIGEFEGNESQLRSFIFSIAHARIVDDLRRSARRSEVSIDNTLNLLAADEPTEDTFSDPDLLGALSRLPAAQRQMLDMRYVVGLSTKETAAAIGKSEVATRVALSRALNKLKGILRHDIGVTDWTASAHTETTGSREDEAS